MYVHAPFCARRCCYCDFAVEVDRSPGGSHWFAAIRTEFETLRDAGDAPLAPALDTLYVGGGTPSLLDPRLVGDLASLFGPERMAHPGFEWTVEANPESFTGMVAREWAVRGVNRVSLGVQSFDPGTLKWMGRLHAPDDAMAAVGRARKAGVTNLSADLIFGLPDTVSRCWKTDVGRILELDVPHISLYGLTVEKGTSLHRAVADGRTPLPVEGRYRDEYLFAAEALSAEGYLHYEVSNFALPGFASRHNRACWQGAPYLGLGNGAHSYHGGRRWWNERDWGVYAERVARSGSGRVQSEVPSAEQSRLEALWLGLRMAEGLDAAALGAAASPLLRSWEAEGLAARVDGRIRLTPEGWLVLDDLTLKLETVLFG